jgi:fatty acid desaturase
MTAWQEALSPEERKSLLALHDGWSWLSFFVDWGLVALSFAAVARFPNPLTVVTALFVIGARQLGLAVLMHEAAHRTLFRNRRLNDFVGNWLCAYPIWNDVIPYRAYHLQHHAKTGTVEDPDLGLATPFPITKASLRRKIWRDLSGQTGWKRAKATFRRDIGKSHGRARRLDWGGVRNFQGVVVTNLVLLGILTLAGHPALYLLWVVAWFTTYSLVMRIRSIAEHAMIPDQRDELRNTRTTIIALWERLLIGPNYVNYHLEHHILMTVPHYNLPRMHRLLRERGALDADCITDGYLQVLEVAASLPA